VWIAEFSESSNFWTQLALLGIPGSTSAWVTVKPMITFDLGENLNILFLFTGRLEAFTECTFMCNPSALKYDLTRPFDTEHAKDGTLLFSNPIWEQLFLLLWTLVISIDSGVFKPVKWTKFNHQFLQLVLKSDGTTRWIEAS
jgi:hypothetical protein